MSGVLQHPHLRATLAELETAVGTQQAIIAKAHAELKELEGRVDSVKEELMRKAAPALYRVPDELFVEIFIGCRDDEFPSPTDDVARRYPKREEMLPLVVSQVCKAWRAIATGTPKLWMTLCLSVDAVPVAVVRSGAVERFIEEWFSRAGARALTLILQAPGEGLRLSGILAQYAPRLERLLVEVTRSDVPVLGLANLPFPLLTEATLVEPSGEEEWEEQHAIFGAAPRLFRVVLAGWASSLTPPWSQLTEFEGRVDDATIFALAVNLKSAVCQLECDDDEDPPTRLFTNSTLETFRCVGKYALLHSVSFPNLRSLHIEDATWFGEEDFEPVASLIEAAAEHLTSLRLSCDKYAGWGFIRTIAKLRKLERLDLHHLGPGTVYGLLRSRGENSLYALEALKYLKLGGVTPHESGWSMAELVHFLNARRGRLQTFQLTWLWELEMDTVVNCGEHGQDTVRGHLKTLAASGMNVLMEVEKPYVYHLEGGI